ADLTAFALQVACWGDPDASGLALLDAPPAGALAAAREALTAIGAVSAEGGGRVSERGVRMARLGLHPRLARALLDGAPVVGARRAAELVALLSEEPPREYGDDLAAALRAARRGADAYGARWRVEVRRLAAGVPEGGSGAEAGGSGVDPLPAPSRKSATPSALRAVSSNAGRAEGQAGWTEERAGRAKLTDDAAAGLVAALAFPERVARARGAGAFLMASGTGAEVGAGSPLHAAPWIAVAVA
ncbi:ATP-dependent helicase HrpB, partial [Streptomyces sp. T-3]|nr:ATP-dependent helicase HrpB [Streptomyces sp. T-3]